MINNTHDETSSLQQLITGSRNGDEAALNQLAEYLLPKAFEFASWKIQNLSPMDDFEDIAISAVKSICLRIRRGEAEFLGEEELGSLLRRFVIGKVRDRRKYHLADKRNINLNTIEDGSSRFSAVQNQTVDEAKPVWLNGKFDVLPTNEQAYLEQMLTGLSGDVQGLFTELVKRLDERPRKVLMLLTTRSMTNTQLAEEMDCAPTSIERYRQSIRRGLENIVNE